MKGRGQKLPFVCNTDMSNFSRLVSGKISTACIHGILVFPRFCTITRTTRLVRFLFSPAVLTNFRGGIRKFRYGRQIEFALPHLPTKWNSIISNTVNRRVMVGRGSRAGAARGKMETRRRSGDFDREFNMQNWWDLITSLCLIARRCLRPVVYPINKSARGRAESNAELLNGIMNPPENGGYVEYGAAVCWICAHSPLFIIDCIWVENRYIP